MKRFLVVLIALIGSVTFWLTATASGRRWILQRTPVADLTVQAVATPQDEDVARALTAKLVAAGKFDDAATIYAGWAKAVSSSAEPLQKQGEALIRASRFGDAAAVLESAIQRDPKNAEALAQLGYVRFLLGDRAQAEEKADAALGIHPESASGNAVKAFVFAERNQFASAKEALQRVKAEEQDSSLYASAKGYIADKEGDAVIAMQSFLAATSRDEYNGQAWAWLAAVQIRTANTDEAFAKAAETLQKASSLLPRAPLIPYSQGLLALKRRDYPGAAAHFQEALNINPGGAEALYQLSVALEMAGRKSESESVRKRFEKLSAYQREAGNLQILLGRDPKNLALWKKLLAMAQANADGERVQLAQDRIAKLSQNP